MKRIVILTILIGSLVGYVEASADNSSPKPQAKMTSSSASLFQSDVSAYDRKNYSVALKVFTELAKQGYAAAQLSLGVMYVVGEGVPKDYVQAAKWFYLAKANGADDLGVIKGLEAKMTRQEIEQAQALAAEWWESHQQ